MLLGSLAGLILVFVACMIPKDYLWPVLLLGVGMMLMTTFTGLGVVFGRQWLERRRIRGLTANGRSADARILHSRRGGIGLEQGTDLKKYQVDLDLEVRPSDGPQFQTHLRAFVYPYEFPRLAPGNVVRVLYAPSDPHRVSLGGFGGMAGGADDDAGDAGQPAATGFPPGFEALAALVAAGPQLRVAQQGAGTSFDALGMVDGLAQRMRVFLETRDPARAAACGGATTGERLRALIAAIAAWNAEAAQGATVTAPARVLRADTVAQVASRQAALVELAMAVRPASGAEFEQTVMCEVPQEQAGRFQPGQWTAVMYDPADVRRMVLAPTSA